MTRSAADRARAAAMFEQTSAAMRDMILALPADKLLSLQYALQYDRDQLLYNEDLRTLACVLAMDTVLRAIVHEEETDATHSGKS